MTEVWKILGTLVAVPLLLLGGCQTALALAHSQRTVSVSVHAAGITALDVNNHAGKVRIVGVEDATEIRLRARIDDGWRDSDSSVTTEGGVLKVEGGCPNFGSSFCQVRYTIEVPSTLPVSVRAEGAIEVSDMTAGVVASSNSSGVTLDRVDGTLDLAADQGRITASAIRSDQVTAKADQGRISLVFAEEPTTVVADADQGSIEIVVPDGTGPYTTDASADQGDENVLVDTSQDSPHTIVAHADQGDVTFAYVSS